MKQILAIGGGAFSAANSNLKLEKYLLKLTKKKNPKICFLPQASNESNEYILKFYQTFLQLGAEPSWCSLFGRVENTWKQHLLSQDIIYVGGGNTKSMMALWQAWEMDNVLKHAYEEGIILTGVSAGGICWFEEGITDSVWPLGIVQGLGILKGSFCPHFDSEVERPPVYRDKVKQLEIQPGIALEDGVAAHFIDGQLAHMLTGIEGKKAFRINVNDEVNIRTTLLA